MPKGKYKRKTKSSKGRKKSGGKKVKQGSRKMQKMIMQSLGKNK